MKWRRKRREVALRGGSWCPEVAHTYDKYRNPELFSVEKYLLNSSIFHQSPYKFQRRHQHELLPISLGIKFVDPRTCEHFKNWNPCRPPWVISTHYLYINMAACVACKKPLVIELEPDEDEDVEMGGSSGKGPAPTRETVPDDVHLNCGCHFHW